LTAYVDVAVIGVAAETVPSPLQFPIQCIQIDVGQQRRQDSSYAKDNFEFDRAVRYR
jgi:hypothetical protein